MISSWKGKGKGDHRTIRLDVKTKKESSLT